MKYRLQSSPMVHTPGLIAWAINGYAFENDRQQLRRVISETFSSLTADAVHKLLSREIPYTVEDEAVVFTVDAPE